MDVINKNNFHMFHSYLYDAYSEHLQKLLFEAVFMLLSKASIRCTIVLISLLFEYNGITTISI